MNTALYPAIGIFLCLISVYFCKIINFYDRPDSNLKLQKKPILYCGGILVIVTAIAYTIMYGFYPITIGLLAISLLGTLDDKLTLSIPLRLVTEVTIILTTSVFILPQLNIFGWICITFFGVALINAVNFIDIKDGLCSGYAIISFLLFTSSTSLPEGLVKLLFLYSYGLLVFYYLNSEPARIYQGDGGSYSVGYLLFCCSITIISNYSNNLTPFFAIVTNSSPELMRIAINDPISLNNITPLSTVIPLYFELIYVFYRRIRLGLNPLKGSPDHIAIVFVSKSYSTYRVLFLFALFPILFTLSNIQDARIFYINQIIIASFFVIIYVYKFLRIDARKTI